MMESIPEWNNDEIRTAEQTAIGNYLAERGFQNNEIYTQTDEHGNITHAGIIDHRVIGIIRDAMNYRKQGAKVENVKKKLTKNPLPKVIKPGVKQNKQEAALKNRSDKAARFNKTGSREDLIAALRERL